MNYYLFAGNEDYDTHANGIRGYIGVFETPEDAYKALGNSMDKWAQLITANPSDGELREYASLIDETKYPDETHRIVHIGWLTTEGVFLGMEARYERSVTMPERVIYPAQQVIDKVFDPHIPKTPMSWITGTWATHQWIESDPF